MKPLTPVQLLAAWERAESASAAERPQHLLAATAPDRPGREWEQLGIAERDARLFDLRTALFGDQVRSLVPCRRCGNDVELNFSLSTIRPGGGRTAGNSNLTFQHRGYSGTFRLPVSSDWVALVAATASHPPAAATDDVRHALARRCVLAASDASGRAADTLPADVAEVVAEAIARLDADAHTEIHVSCPDCGHAWPALFDIASFLWREVDFHCRQLLRQVHTLARAYGWTEAEVLHLSPARRQHYLGLIEHG